MGATVLANQDQLCNTLSIRGVGCGVTPCHALTPIWGEGGGGGRGLQLVNTLFGMKLRLGMRLGRNMGRADCVAVHRAHHPQGSLCCIAT